MHLIGKGNSNPWFLKILLYLVLVANSNCLNGQNKNIYTEESWEARDKWQRSELIIEQLEINPGDNVADVGCHEGYMTVKLAVLVSNTGKVFAVDTGPYKLNKLRDNLKARDLENVTESKGIQTIQSCQMINWMLS